MHWDESNTCNDRRPSDGGFTLVETLLSIAVLTTVSLGVAQLFAVTAMANRNAKDKTSTSVLAVQKMEQLRGLTWGFAVGAGGQLGLPTSDLATDLSVDPPMGGGPGLQPSPAGTLETNTPLYVDYLGADGSWLGTGASPPAGTVYIRRWAVEPLPTSPTDTLVLQVMTTTLKQERLRQTASGTGPRGRLPADTWLVSVKTRKAL